MEKVGDQRFSHECTQQNGVEPESISPRTDFDWGIYADATFAGLSVLIPLPLIDLFFEWLFKRRMPAAIAGRNGRKLDPAIVRYVNRGRFGCWPGCLVWPIMLVFEFLKRFYRTVLYFLTIKSATDRLSYYWHRAFLLDYMVRRGDLDDLEQAQLAVAALNQVLDNVTTSPLMQLAQQIISGVSHVLRAMWQWLRRRREAKTVETARARMERSWADFGAYLVQVAHHYDLALRELEAQRMSDVPVVLHEAEQGGNK